MNTSTYLPSPRRADADLSRVLSGQRHLLFDGAMGTMLQRAGLAAGASPELLNLSDPGQITRIHRAYVEVGCEAITTNTFGANRHKLAGKATVEEVFSAAVSCARAADARWVAADIGPIGALMAPLGTLSFDEAYDCFAEQVRAAASAGADLFIIETMTDLLEVKAALLAVRENSDLPVFCTMTFEEDGRTFLGTSPEIAAVTLAGLGADAVGINCSLGPTELFPLVERMAHVVSTPLIVQANAGLPHVENGKTCYSISAGDYAHAVAPMLDAGVTILGGCCGTDPAYMALVRERMDAAPLRERHVPAAFNVTSAQALVSLSQDAHRIAVIGERINPTGKKRLQQALRNGDMDYLVSQGIAQQEQGADILDVNVGLPGIDETSALTSAIERLSGAVTLPLQLASTDAAALEAGARRYPGLPIVNSVNGKQEVLDAVLPIVAKYGCCVVGLTLDEDGIPDTGAERYRIAERIVREAARYGIGPERILIDCLVMTASTNQAQVMEILSAMRLCKENLGVKCALGVSNVSFGLPARPLLNSTFLTAAFACGLDCPIMNPASSRSMDAVRSFKVLSGEDEGSARYIDTYAGWTDPYKIATGAAEAGSGTTPLATGETGSFSTLQQKVISGRKGEVAQEVSSLLATNDPMDLVNNELIPALDEVGDRFDKGTFFLPQLMAAAEAARAGFDTIKAALPGSSVASKGKICVATVQGDIHDIGKNIVKMLLDNYGYTVIDLGRDVDPQAVLDAVRAHRVSLVGLSALMTTTVANMEATIDLLHRKAPGVKVMVGGAVLTPEYAAQIGADFYAKDAAESARIAEQVFSS